ncbi:MAG TPA: hypothetical protein VIL74_21255 [Pyrinomonadaceae bacterium]
MIFNKIIFAVLIIFPSFSAFSQSVKKPEVFVLSTLHQHHAESKYYSFETLSKIVEKLRPDVLAVELTPADLASRRDQKTKQEYQKSIFPLVDRHRFKTVAMEPAEPKFSEMVSLIRDSEKDLKEKTPEKAAAFSLYVETLYDYLFEFWDSPRAVNSARTDAFFEVKHEYQNALFDERQKRGWENWNAHFLSQILDVAKTNPGKRVVVTVGAEHSFWLRKRLRENEEVKFLEAEKILK